VKGQKVKPGKQGSWQKREEDERSRGSVWVTRQVTVRVKDQDGPTEREEDERSGGSMWITAWQKGRGAKGHMWVMSVTGKQGEESERVIGEQGKGSEL
jgi:hypothetical protein